MRFNKVVQAIGAKETLEQNKLQASFGRRWAGSVLVKHPYRGCFGMRTDFVEENDELFFYIKDSYSIQLGVADYAQLQNLTLVGRNFFKK